MSMKFKNNASSKLATSLTAEATTLKVIAGTGSNFPSIVSPKEYFHATLVGDNGDMEIIRVTNISGDTFTVVRAQENTVAKEWSAGTRLENRITAEFLNQVATGDTIKFDQVTIKTDSDGVSSVDPAEVYPPASSTELGVVKVDEETITISEDNAISVLPSGIIDNSTIVLDENGKLTSKSIPFDKPSANRWHQSNFIFSAVANTAVPVKATNLVSYDTSANNSVLFEPNSSGQLICRKTGLYGVRVEFSTYYVGDGSTAMDGWFYIKLNNIDIGSSGTPLLAAANEPNVFTCYVNRRIEAGQIISTAWNIPYTGNVSVNYIDYQFTYFPTTNEYQVRNPSRTAVNIQQLSNHPVNVYGDGKMFDVWCGKVLNDDLWEDEAIGKIIYRTDAPDEVYGIEIQEDGMYIITTSLWGTVTQGQYEYTICIAGSQNKNVAPSWVFYGPTSIFNAINSFPDSATCVYCVQLFKGNVIYLSGISYTPLESGIGSDDFYGKLEVVRMSSVTNNVTTFTPPTASEPGKAGLVPQPQATDPSEQLANILTMRGWAGFDPAAIMPSIAGDGSNILGLGAESAEGVNIDTLLRTGFFAASSFSGTLPPNTAGGILINLFAAASGLYYGQQILVSLYGNVWCRSNNGGIPAGGTPSWTAWQAVGAPKPQSSDGVGKWQGYSNQGAGNTVTLPEGYTWAYFFIGTNADGSVHGITADVAAGGTIVQIGSTVKSINGFVWRVQ